MVFGLTYAFFGSAYPCSIYKRKLHGTTYYKDKKIYHSQRDYLIHCSTTTFSTNIHVSGYSTGLHPIADLKDIKFSKEILKRIKQFCVKVYPIEDHSIEKGKHHHRIFLGFGY